ncbi:hypothetical protein A3F08_01000, partial [Candidatus Berkelbacteria bacterium RIFCSPHIGHO2_12_FULL_36_9]
MLKFLKVFLFLISIFFVFNYAQAEEKSIVFNEIFWSGSFVSSADEFIELKNVSNQNIDISGWQITKLNTSGEEKIMTTIEIGIIPALGYFLIANNEKDHLFIGGESVLNIDPDIVEPDLTLSNSEFQLKLYDGQWDDGRLPIDIAGDGSAPLAGNNSVKSSMERINPLGDGVIRESWISSVVLENLDASALELANPHGSGKPKINIPEVLTPVYIFGQTEFLISVKAEDPDGQSDIASVTADLSIIGSSNFQTLFDNGTNGDITANDGIYSFLTTVDYLISAGLKNIPISVADNKALVAKSELQIPFYHLSDQLIINEIHPHPLTGTDDEFVEIFNSGNQKIDLFGWKIDDVENGGSQPYILTENDRITNKEYIAYYKTKTKIGLNDDGDIVRLIRPDGVIINTNVNYLKAEENYSYSRVGNEWKWSTVVTPNKENIIIEPIKEVPQTVMPESNQGGSSEVLVLDLPIMLARKQAEGAVVRVEGIINVLPGVFSSQYFYIQDSEAGIQIYYYKKDFPDLKLFNHVKIKGEISIVSSGIRIKIRDRSDIEIISSETISPSNVKTGDVGENYEGMLVKIKGKITGTKGSIFYLDDGSGQVKCYIKSSTNIKKPRLTKNMEGEIIGIVSKSNDIWQIMPRMQSDLLF